MLDSHGFNLWAGDYDKSVNTADENNDYPFAGYKKLMNAVYGTIMDKSPASVLDIGLGTGTLASRLYAGGNEITGIDFSSEMLQKAKEKMPGARLIKCDFSKGLPEELKNARFDFIISTYAFHHLNDAEKVEFILSLLSYLKENGSIIIGDVGFQNREDLEKCRESSGDDWDNDEIYFVFSEIEKELSGKCIIKNYQFSHCSGVLEIYPSKKLMKRSVIS